MKKLGLLFVVLGSGCGGDEPGPAPTPDAAVPPPLEYQGFTVATQTIGYADGIGILQYAVTDTTGPIACGLATDQRSGLGTTGHVIIAAMEIGFGWECKTGVYSIKPCAEPTSVSFLQPGCAYYRRYDQQGQLLGTLSASAGAITVSGDGTACTYEINLGFSGEAFSHTYTVMNPSGDGPWCSP